MKKSFDYSKWDKIELSDDESDLHPNIDKDSWFRLKHRTRIEREEKEDEEIKRINQLNSEDLQRLNIINARLNGLKSGKEDEDAEFEDIDALKDEKSELTNNINQRNKRVEDINERRKWNIDNICKTKDEKTIVNSPDIVSLNAADFQPTGQTEAVLAKHKEEKAKTKAAGDNSTSSTGNSSISDAAEPPTTVFTNNTTVAKPTTSSTSPQLPDKKREKFAMISYNDYVLKHEATLEEYSVIKDMEETKKYLFKFCDVLLHEHAQSYMLLSCLEDEMNGKKERMKLVCRQSQILSHITELGVQMHRDPRDVILPFFRRMEENQYLTGFLQAVEEFRVRIVERAKVKRREMDREERSRRKDEVPVGPGGKYSTYQPIIHVFVLSG